MEIVVYIIGVFSLALFVVPFIISARNRKRKEKGLLLALGVSLQNGKWKIGEHEFINNFVIGLDEKSEHLFYCKRDKNQEIVHKIRLTEIEACRIININRPINAKGSHYSEVDKLDLCLSFIDKKKAEVILPFYNSEDGNLMNGETHKIELWSANIKKRLKHYAVKS